MADSLILTTAGLAKLAIASPESPVQISHLAVGDGGGGYPAMTPSWTALANEVWRGTASEPIREPGNPTVLKFETVIPSEDGGFFIRELGLFDSTGTLIAVAQCSVVEKPGALSSTALTMTVAMRLTLANAAQTQVVVSDTPYIDHGGLSGRSTPGAHPMAAIDGLTNIQTFTGGGALPSTITGAVSLRAVGAAAEYTMPSVYSATEAEITFYSARDSSAAVFLNAQPGQLRAPAEIQSGYGGLFLPEAGSWATVRPNLAAGAWEVVAAHCWQRNPTETQRGMPLAATVAEQLAGQDHGKMSTPAGVAALFASMLRGRIQKTYNGPCLVKTSAGEIAIRAGTKIALPGSIVEFASDTPLHMPTLAIGDYCVLVGFGGAVSVVADPMWAPAAVPSGAVKIGGFHYGPVMPGTTLAGGGFNTATRASDDFKWTQAALDLIVGINAHSIWDLQWRPKCDPRGMTCVTSEFGAALFWVDIYLCGTNHLADGTSKYGSNVASGTVLPARAAKRGGGNYAALSWFVAAEIAFDHGKRLMSYQEFAEMAYGVTEAQSLGGAESTIPATAFQAGYTSRFGVAQATGHHWVYGNVAHADSGAAWVAGAQRGQTFGAPVRAIFGGSRSHAAYSGSRCSLWIDSAWLSAWNAGLRAACDHLVLQ